MTRRGVALLAFAALFPATRASAAQGTAIVNVSATFRPGPYTALTVDPRSPETVAIGTADGHVLWTTDGGITAHESAAVSARDYAVLVLRGNNLRHREYAGLAAQRGATRLFLRLLQEDLPVTRWAVWMALDNTRAQISDVTLAPHGERMALASSAGVYTSDSHRGVWTRVAGGPRAKGEPDAGYAVAFDPDDPSHVLAATSGGMLVSHDGGNSFVPHADARLAGGDVRRLLWPADAPDRVLAIAGDTVLQSRDGGRTFAAALTTSGAINAIALGDDGAYVATSKGLLVPGGNGTSARRLSNQAVVGVVPIGDGMILAATEETLVLLTPDGDMVLARTTAEDPFVRLAGSPALAWAITRHCVFRIGASEPRMPVASPPPELKLSLDEIQRATLARLGIYDPETTRLADRWYAKLLPQVVVRVKGIVENQYALVQDGTLPLSYRFASATARNSCCGGAPGEPAVATVILLQWDLSRVVFGRSGQISNPNAMIEQGLRPIRDQVLGEIRWRYRECANLARLLARPAENPRVALSWRLRLEEHAAYIEAMSGRKLLSIEKEEVP